MAHVQRLAPAGEAPLAPGLSAVPPDARLVVITDALGDQDMLVQRLRSRPAGRGPITLLHVVARDELELPSGVHRVDDPERPMEPRQISPAHRQAYVERFADFRRQVAGLWRELGATCTLVTTDDDPVRSVRALVAQASSEIGSVRP